MLITIVNNNYLPSSFNCTSKHSETINLAI
jgi:hypothetical protein